MASPAYLMRMGVPLADLDKHDCIRLRSATTGRLREWQLHRGGRGGQRAGDGPVVMNDLEAICDCAPVAWAWHDSGAPCNAIRTRGAWAGAARAARAARHDSCTSTLTTPD
ncbi:MAG: hypothetical protein IPO19_14790 [Rhodoferax sp.]|nr:hypothetical protein [Rhodoferax sp.]